MQTEDTEPTPSAAQRAMEHHARARRYTTGDSFTFVGVVWKVRSVSIVSRWHVVLQLVAEPLAMTIELDPDDDIVRRSDCAGEQLSLIPTPIEEES